MLNEDTHIFSGKTAWFSGSIPKEKRVQWESNGGGFTCDVKNADYVFSDNCLCTDTIRLVQELKDTVVFKSDWITEATSISNKNNTKRIEQFILKLNVRERLMDATKRGVENRPKKPGNSSNRSASSQITATPLRRSKRLNKIKCNDADIDFTIEKNVTEMLAQDTKPVEDNQSYEAISVNYKKSKLHSKEIEIKHNKKQGRVAALKENPKRPRAKRTRNVASYKEKNEFSSSESDVMREESPAKTRPPLKEKLTDEIGTPKRKRKLYKVFDVGEDEVLSTSVEEARSTQLLSPSEINDILKHNTPVQNVALSNVRFFSPDDNDVISPSRVSRQEVIRKYKDTLAHKRLGERTVEDFAFGSFSGFTHINDLDIPDLLLEDFIVSKDGCLVKLISR